MRSPKRTTVDLDAELRQRVEEFRERMQATTGMEFSMAKIIQHLIRKGLETKPDRQRIVR